ncbi:hypothetical protein HETIRDRAFT_125388 [Heterobasidion irregulare TC 32-1]|uniref:Deacetylase sirtuin-type domain-containing protein n=1 Tax=Heterobasidion irregulare (strain TC 32-1) TaxID=747525 RepID=W4JVM7_HETIT|nr:uncharacterized protein HETIRDRAFT_125388 [Heterobasidion irregulare TC 32-1]ETW77534.1 hypothetical protein HETIRDRAFT_125388 [Heterobasidion irregulare TC 32-1]
MAAKLIAELSAIVNSKTLASSKTIIAIAGAGLSAASGIPTFGAGGMWRKHDALMLATPAAFRRSPSRVWQFYHYRRERALTAQPNDAHIAPAKFSLPEYREQIAPGSTFTLITQNVDGLSRRALYHVRTTTSLESTEHSSTTIEMHGRLFDVVCTAYKCGYRVVWFGEIPHHIEDIFALVKRADLALVIGTSSTVNPAAKLASKMKGRGGKVAVFNADRSNEDEEADFLFLGPCETMLPDALGFEKNS